MKSIKIRDIKGHHQRNCISYVAHSQKSLENIGLEPGHLCQANSSLNPDSLSCRKGSNSKEKRGG